MRHISRRYVVAPALVFLILVNCAFAGLCGKNAPKTVASALTSMGNVKRDLRARGEITPQQSKDISEKLDAANRSYRQFVTDEQKRLADGTPDPNARAAALAELRSLLNGLRDPSVLGIKSDSARKIWNESVATLNTVLAGLGG